MTNQLAKYCRPVNSNKMILDVFNILALFCNYVEKLCSHCWIDIETYDGFKVRAGQVDSEVSHQQ